MNAGPSSARSASRTATKIFSPTPRDCKSGHAPRPTRLLSVGKRRSPIGRNLTILQKGLILIAVPALFQLVFLAGMFRMQRQSADAQFWALHTQDVITLAERTFRQFIEAHSNARAYVLTQNPVFRETANGFLDNSERDFLKLRELVADNPQQLHHLAEMQAVGDSLEQWIRNILDDSTEHAEAVAEIHNLAGKQRLDALRSEVDAFLGDERLLQIARRTDLERSWRSQTWLLAGGVGLVLALAMAMLSLFQRGIVGRIDRLTEKTRLLGEGLPLTQPLSGNDEIVTLDRRFHEMARALAERNQENEMFVYSVSHDLRSPLVNLQGFSEELTHSSQELAGTLANQQLADPRATTILREEIPESIHFIQAAVARMATIIDALLRLSRAGRVEYTMTQVDVETIVRRVVASLHGDIDRKNATVVVLPLEPTWGDATAIEQLFGNLIANAVYYLDPERPGRIEVGMTEVIENGQPAERVFHVRDNGLGIPQDYQAKLFVAFQRFHPGASKGEGIGLALVRRIVQRHGGRIWAESAPGEGSTFYVALPQATLRADHTLRPPA